MAREVERKFLVADGEWRAHAGEGVTISQFYVAAGDDRSIRLRLQDDGRATLTLKFGGAALARDEFEYDVAPDDARAMERFALGRVIEKTRYRVPHRGHVYEVDAFKRSLAGLVIAELETEDSVADADLPSWLGREITGEAAFYNVSLAMNGPPGDE
jgi:adenylate cyclase